MPDGWPHPEFGGEPITLRPLLGRCGGNKVVLGDIAHDDDAAFPPFEKIHDHQRLAKNPAALGETLPKGSVLIVEVEQRSDTIDVRGPRQHLQGGVFKYAPSVFALKVLHALADRHDPRAELAEPAKHPCQRFCRHPIQKRRPCFVADDILETPIVRSHSPVDEVVGQLRDDGDEVRICLLYTSPSPRDLSTSRMPSSA